MEDQKKTKVVRADLKTLRENLEKSKSIQKKLIAQIKKFSDKLVKREKTTNELESKISKMIIPIIEDSVEMKEELKNLRLRIKEVETRENLLEKREKVIAAQEDLVLTKITNQINIDSSSSDEKEKEKEKELIFSSVQDQYESAQDQYEKTGYEMDEKNEIFIRYPKSFEGRIVSNSSIQNEPERGEYVPQECSGYSNRNGCTYGKKCAFYHIRSKLSSESVNGKIELYCYYNSNVTTYVKRESMSNIGKYNEIMKNGCKPTVCRYHNNDNHGCHHGDKLCHSIHCN